MLQLRLLQLLRLCVAIRISMLIWHGFLPCMGLTVLKISIVALRMVVVLLIIIQSSI
eukprot:COSAG05_NODE_7921_length_755_cov_1.170732_1_plen_56_part_10